MIYYEHVPSPNDLIYSDLTISKYQYELIYNAWLTLAPTLSSTFLRLTGFPLQKERGHSVYNSDKIMLIGA